MAACHYAKAAVDDVTNAYGTGGYYPKYPILGPGAVVILCVGSARGATSTSGGTGGSGSNTTGTPTP